MDTIWGAKGSAAGAGWKLQLVALFMAAVPHCGAAQPVQIFVPVRGEDLRNAPVLEKTAAYLARKLPGHQFNIVRIYGDNWADRVAREGAGFVFMDPAQFVQLEARLSILPVAAVERVAPGGRTRFTGGVVFSRRETPLRSPADLKGLTFAFVEGDPMAASLSVLRELKAVSGDPQKALGTVVTVPNDQTVVEAVKERRADAGAVSAGVLENLAAAGRLSLADFNVLALAKAGSPDEKIFPFQISTRLYPERLIASLPGTDPDLSRQVAAGLLSASATDLDPEGTAGAGWTLSDARENVRQTLRELQRPPYAEYGEVTVMKIFRQYMYWFIGAASVFVLLLLLLSYTTSLNRTLSEAVEEQKGTHTELQRSLERFEHLATCSGDWIWETDAGEHFTYSNEALQPLLGWPPKNVIGKAMFDFLSAGEKEKLGDVRLVLGGDSAKVFRRRLTLLTSDGRVAVHDCTAGPIRNIKGEITGYRGINRDVTAGGRVVSFR